MVQTRSQARAQPSTIIKYDLEHHPLNNDGAIDSDSILFYDANEHSEFDYSDIDDGNELDDLVSDYESELDEEDEDVEDEDDIYAQSNDDLQFKDESKKELVVEYNQHTTLDLIQRMKKQAEDLSNVLQVTTDQAITLLQYYSWNSEALMDSYLEDPDKISKKVGLDLTNNTSKSKSRKNYNNGDFSCPICCDDRNETYQLNCGHEYCIPCYGQYIKDKVTVGNIIKCPSCELTLTSHDIDEITGFKGESFKLLENSIKGYIERQPTFRWCPSPDCDIVLELLNSFDIKSFISNNRIPIIKCKHGHQFCYQCNFENHSPLPCSFTKAWITKCKDDSETVKWIISYTKQCPKCTTVIEKNGGCNHMTCKKCRYEFCWICLGNWDQHGRAFYQCTRYKEKEVKNITKEALLRAKRQSLQRYIHHYNLFTIYEVSIKQDQKRCVEVEETIRSLQEASGISWIEAQFLNDSAATLLRARRVLKWSCALGYYCTTSNSFHIFEGVQANLSQAVENLSKLFEIEDPQEIVNKKREFLNRRDFLSDREQAMISSAKDLISTAGTLYSPQET